MASECDVRGDVIDGYFESGVCRGEILRKIRKEVERGSSFEWSSILRIPVMMRCLVTWCVRW